MAIWLATIRFRDGRELFARYSTVNNCVSDHELYERHVRAGEINSYGSVSERSSPDGDPLPAFPERPLSPIEKLQPVQIVLDRDSKTWGALFCPNRQMLAGPHDAFRARSLGEHAYIAQLGGCDHLVRMIIVDHGTYVLPEPDKETLCGQPVTSEPGYLEPARDPFAEWDRGTVCLPCLLYPLALGNGH